MRLARYTSHVTAVSVLALIACTARAQNQTEPDSALASAAFSGRWVRPNEPLIVRRHQPPQGELRVFIGTR